MKIEAIDDRKFHVCNDYTLEPMTRKEVADLFQQKAFGNYRSKGATAHYKGEQIRGSALIERKTGEVHFFFKSLTA